MAISKIKTNSIANDAITSDKLATGGIATVDMADGSVTTSKTGFSSETGAIIPPKGTTGQRPTAVAGQLRFNTTLALMEYYNGTVWKSIDSPPVVSFISPTTFNGESGTTITINGSNFQSGATASFISNGGTAYNAAVTTVVSSSQITATTPQDFTVADEPFDIKVTNASSLFGTLPDALDCGATPTWVTTAGDLYSGTSIYESELAINTKTFSATDADAGSTVAYSVTSGALPSGSLVSGVWTPGTLPTVASDTTYSFTVRATDNAGNTTDRAFSTAVKDDPSLAYTGNLRIWLRGGYNGATAGLITAGSNVITAAKWGSSTGTINSVGTVSRTYSTITNSPGNSSAGRYIKDSAGGVTAVLQDDKLQFGTDPNDYFWQTLPSNNSVFDASTANATFCYWMVFENRSEVTNSDQIYPTFHSWSGGGVDSSSLIAHDWWTGGTNSIYLNYYRNSSLVGVFTPTGIGGSNGGKGVWFHFAITHTASVTKTYVNGVEQANVLSNPGSWLSIGAAQGINFSGRCDGVSGGAAISGTTGTGFKGWADMRYYNATLTSAAIAAIYAKSRSSFI